MAYFVCTAGYYASIRIMSQFSSGNNTKSEGYKTQLGSSDLP